MWVGLCPAPLPRAVLIADYARYRVKEKLQTVPGVGEITLGGYLERNVRIWVDANSLGRARVDGRAT
jgi:multidrug efflux pump subunit AcrB